MSDDNNLTLWNSVCKTDPSHTKGFKGKGGFQGTAICAQWQRYKATELWGPFGGNWKIVSEAYELTPLSDDFHDTILVYTGLLSFPEGQIHIKSEIDVWNYSKKYDSWSKNNDMHKKVSTDALTKGLSTLGFSADVFMGKFDDNKYVNDMREEFGEKTPPIGKDRIDKITELAKENGLDMEGIVYKVQGWGLKALIELDETQAARLEADILAYGAANKEES